MATTGTLWISRELHSVTNASAVSLSLWFWWKKYHPRKSVVLLRRKGGFRKNGSTLTSLDLGGQIKWSALSANWWIHCSRNLILNAMMRPITSPATSSWVKSANIRLNSFNTAYLCARFLCSPQSWETLAPYWHSVIKTLRTPGLKG